MTIFSPTEYPPDNVTIVNTNIGLSTTGVILIGNSGFYEYFKINQTTTWVISDTGLSFNLIYQSYDSQSSGNSTFAILDYNGVIVFETITGLGSSHGYCKTLNNILDNGSGLLQPIAFKMIANANNGYVLTSDASGNGTWQPITTNNSYAISMQTSTNVSTSISLLITPNVTGNIYVIANASALNTNVQSGMGSIVITNTTTSSTIVSNPANSAVQSYSVCGIQTGLTIGTQYTITLTTQSGYSIATNLIVKEY